MSHCTNRTLLFPTLCRRSARSIQPQRRLNLSARFIHAEPTVSSKSPFVGYARPTTFSIATCTSIFFTAAYLHDKDEQSLWKKLKQRTSTDLHRLRDIVTEESLLKHDLWRTKMQLWLQRKDDLMKRLQQRLDQYQSMPIHIKKSILNSAQLYLDISERDKTMLSIATIHLFVFAASRIPRYQKFIQRYFVHRGERTITLFTSIFLHRSLGHWAVSMAGLVMAGCWLYDRLGREQFIATYLSLGIGANLTSHILRLAMLRRGYPVTMITLGSDSTFYGLLTGTSIIYPQAVFHFPLVEGLSALPASYTIPAFLGADALGLFLRWNRYDHIAHVGGAIIGWTYGILGPTFIWPKTLEAVRKIKMKVSSRGGNGNNGNSGGESPSGALMLIPEKLRRKLKKKAASAVPEGES